MMPNKRDIRAILEREWPGLPGETLMALSICEHGAPHNIPNDELIAKAARIKFAFKASTPSDDDMYWLAQSPFDGKWYTFALLSGLSGTPRTPMYIDDKRPEWFDED